MKRLVGSGIGLIAAFAVLLGVAPWPGSMTAFLVAFGTGFVCYVVAAAGARRTRGRGSWLWVLGIAVAVRGLTLAAPLSLSDDLYRYLWDGRVLGHGVNPYRYAPDAPELAPLRDDAIWPRINNPSLPTIYPPLLQAVFAPVAAVLPTVFGMRLAMTVFDLAAGMLLMLALAAAGRPRAAALVYLWNPLVVIEFAGSGHADAVGMFLLAAGLYGWVRARPLLSGTGLALAGLVKFLPWCAVPLLAPRLKWKWLLLPALVAAAYLPFQLGGVNVLGSLGVFAATWRANDFVFGWLVHDSGDPQAALLAAKRWGVVIVAVVWLIAVLLRRPWPSVFSWTVGAALLVSPVAHPWYVTWLIPGLVFLPHVAWLAWSGLVVLAYLPLPGFLNGVGWVESPPAKLVQYLPVLVLVGVQVVLEWRARSRLPG